MNVADYIFDFLSEKGVDTAFMVSGGQAMYLVDALQRSKSIKTICTHHEQSAGMAAEAYGRLTKKLAVALVTAGPGSVNVINGVVGGWTDSSPMLVVSGQSALASVQYQQKTKIRQYGIQGINIQPLVENVTKFFITVDDPKRIRYYMEKAYYLALNGRPGPVWIDVPLDVQKMEVPDELNEKYDPPIERTDPALLQKQIAKTLYLITNSQRPIFIAGQGVRIAGVSKEFANLQES